MQFRVAAGFGPGCGPTSLVKLRILEFTEGAVWSTHLASARENSLSARVIRALAEFFWLANRISRCAEILSASKELPWRAKNAIGTRKIQTVRGYFYALAREKILSANGKCYQQREI